MESNISKSSEMLAKEALIHTLRSKLKKQRTTLKRLKTRLENVKGEIKEIQINTQNILFAKISKLESLRKEIGELSQKVNTSKQFSKSDKMDLNELAQDFLEEHIFGSEFEGFREAERKIEEGDFDENARAEMRDMFQEFRVEPDQEEQKNIREVFKNLSRKFHPDLAKNKKQEAEYHRLMLQINEAYAAHDVHTLLEMEQRYLTEEFDLSGISITSDMLQLEIKRLQSEIESINGQIDRTSLEIKQIRQSDLGQMLTGVKKAEREGAGLEAMEAEFDGIIQMLEQMKAGFEDSLDRGEVSPILTQMIDPLDAILQGDMPGGMEGIEDLLSMFSYDYEENENPVFPPGSAVKVKVAIKHPYDFRISTKNWQGWVEGAYIDEEGSPFYSVLFDSETMKSMPKSLLRKAIAEGEDFQELDFFEHQLVSATRREERAASLITYRMLQTEAQWETLVKGKKLELVKSILLADPEEDDQTNWGVYLAGCMPFQAKGKGQFELQRNKQVKAKKLYDFHPNIGFTALVQEEKGKKRPYEYPLFDLIPLDDQLKMVVELHDIWFHEVYLDDEGLVW